MCGCMIESNASIAAAAQLAPLLDYADLDGSLLLAEDQYDGSKWEAARSGSGTRSGRGPAPARARSSSASVPLFVGVDLGLL